MSDTKVADSQGQLIKKQQAQLEPQQGLPRLAVARWFGQNPQLAYSATVLLMGTVGFIRQTIYFDTFGITYIAYAGLTDMVVDSVEIVILLFFWTMIVYIFGIVLLGYFVLLVTAAARMGYIYTAGGARILRPFLHPHREFGSSIKSEWDMLGGRLHDSNEQRREAMKNMWRGWNRIILGFLRNGPAFFVFMVFLLISIGAFSGVSARGVKYCRVQDTQPQNIQTQDAGAGLFCRVGDQPGKGRVASIMSGITMSGLGHAGDLIGIPNLFRTMFERPLLRLTLTNGTELSEAYIMLGSTSSHSFFYGPMEEGAVRLAVVIRRDSLSIVRAYSGARGAGR